MDGKKGEVGPSSARIVCLHFQVLRAQLTLHGTVPQSGKPKLYFYFDLHTNRFDYGPTVSITTTVRITIE